jgi:2-iminobutanoate/2-iminopropanoate deaminase
MSGHIKMVTGGPTPVGPYSSAVIAQGFVFISGQIPLNPQTNTLEDFDGDIKKQTELVLSNLQLILEAAGCTKNDVVKTTILLTDINDFAQVNLAYGDFFGEHKPARATYAVAALPKGAKLEIEAIACCTSKPR